MDQDKHRRLIQQILRPTADQGPRLLEDLGLSGLPSREQVHHEIEEKLLLPRERLPDHWLPTYQMYARYSSTSNAYLTLVSKTLAS
jgi:antiviral helicase SKI2